MNHEVFWTLLENARKAGKNEQEGMCVALADALEAMPPGEIAAFDRLFHEVRERAYRWDLWGAAHVMDGGCSDLGFEHFRNWLIGMGRRVYEGALANPDTLAGAPSWLIEDGVHEFTALSHVAGDVHEHATGTRPPSGRVAAAPAGEEFEFEVEEEMRRRYPRLAEKYMRHE